MRKRRPPEEIEWTLPVVKDAALRRLSFREQSEAELRKILTRKGAPENLVDQALAELRELGYVNDDRYERAWTRHQIQRGKGPSYILHQLKAKGVKSDLSKVRRAMGEEADLSPEDAELQAARAVVERRYPDAGRDREEGRRAYQALLRRGFSSAVARRAIFESAQVADSEGDFSSESDDAV